MIVYILAMSKEKQQTDQTYIDAERGLLAVSDADSIQSLEDDGILDQARERLTETGTIQPGELDENPLVEVKLVNKTKIERSGKVFQAPTIEFSKPETYGDTGVVENRQIPLEVAKVYDGRVIAINGFDHAAANRLNNVFKARNWAQEQGILPNLLSNGAEIKEPPRNDYTPVDVYNRNPPSPHPSK